MILAQDQVPSGLTALLIASVPLSVAVLRALTGGRPRPATVVRFAPVQLVGAAIVGLAVVLVIVAEGRPGKCRPRVAASRG